jgi:hypothetical protein
MRKKYFLGFLLFLFLISSCGPSESDLQTMLAETIVAMPSSTPYPTYTPYPTQTPHIIIVTPTNTPSPTLTLTPTNPPYSFQQMTATVVQATKEYVAEFKIIAWKELNYYSDKHSGEKIKIKGKVFQIIDSIDMLLWYPSTYDAFYVAFDEEYSDVYEDQSITIYGTIIGQYCYSTQSGGSNCVPQIRGEWFSK